MKRCKEIQKSFIDKGSKIDKNMVNHLKSCTKCSEISEKEKSLDLELAKYAPVPEPEYLTGFIVSYIHENAPRRIKNRKYLFLTKSAITLLIIIAGFWIGMATSTGSVRQLGLPEVVELSETDEYLDILINSSGEALNEIYFSFEEGANNGH